MTRHYGTPDERFWAQVDQTASDCWEWVGVRMGSRAGYGQFSVNGKLWRAHRWAYQRFVAPIPDGMALDHLCRNKCCVNPDHLEPVTPSENTRRHYALVTHCPQNHAYDEDNTYVKPNGTRRCRACNTTDARRYRTRRSA